MKLQDQVITIEQAKRLKELGIDQDGCFFWYQDRAPRNPNQHYYGVSQEYMPWELYLFGKKSKLSTSNVFEECCAFTVTEMGRMIGSGTFAAQKFHDAVAARINSSHSMTIATAPQFVGNFLIAALEQEILTLEEANTRLLK